MVFPIFWIIDFSLRIEKRRIEKEKSQESYKMRECVGSIESIKINAWFGISIKFNSIYQFAKFHKSHSLSVIEHRAINLNEDQELTFFCWLYTDTKWIINEVIVFTKVENKSFQYLLNALT